MWVLIDAAVCSTLGLSAFACFAQVTRSDFRVPKRLLAGVYVDAEAPAAPIAVSSSSTATTSTPPRTSSLLSTPISALPRARLSFGVSCAPSSSRAGSVIVDLSKSLVSGDVKRPRTSVGQLKSGAKTVAEKEGLRMSRAKKEVFDLLSRAGADSAVYREKSARVLGTLSPARRQCCLGS